MVLVEGQMANHYFDILYIDLQTGPTGLFKYIHIYIYIYIFICRRIAEFCAISANLKHYRKIVSCNLGHGHFKLFPHFTCIGSLISYKSSMNLRFGNHIGFN